MADNKKNSGNNRGFSQNSYGHSKSGKGSGYSHSPSGNNSASKPKMPSKQAKERIERQLKGSFYSDKKGKGKQELGNEELQFRRQEYIKEKRTAPKTKCLELSRTRSKKYRHISDVQRQKFNLAKTAKANITNNAENKGKHANSKFRYAKDNSGVEKNRRFIVVNGNAVLNAEKYGQMGGKEVSAVLNKADKNLGKAENMQKSFYKMQRKVMFFNRMGKAVGEFAVAANSDNFPEAVTKTTAKYTAVAGAAVAEKTAQKLTENSKAANKMFKVVDKTALGARKITGYAAMTAGANHSSDNIGTSAENALTAAPKAIVKDTALGFAKGTISGGLKLHKKNMLTKQRAFKKHFFLKNNTTAGKLINNAAEKTAVVAARAVKEIMLMIMRAAVAAGVTGGAIAAVLLIVVVVFFAVSSQSKAAFPFDYKVVITDDGEAEYEELDPIERISEFKAVMDELVDETNNLIASLFGGGGISPDNNDTGAVYMGARWHGETEAESVPYGVHYDEMLCTLAAYYIKLVSNPAENEDADDDFHVMNEDDVYEFYNSLPFWVFEVWQEIEFCEGCVEYTYTISGTDEEGNSYSETVTVLYCPGHIWDVCNLILYFEHKGGMESVWELLQFDEQDFLNYEYIKEEYDRILSE